MKTLIRFFRIVHSGFFFVWVVVSTIAYSIPTMVIALIHRPWGAWIGRIWSRNLLLFGGVRVRVHGLEKLDRSTRYVFIVNHQSHIDIPVLIANIPYVVSFIAKKELFRIPFFGWGIAALGHVWIDRSHARKARASITRAVQQIQKQHTCLVLFPEGTRSETGEVGEFKRGSFNLVIESGAPVVPIALSGTRTVIPKRSLFIAPGIVHLCVGDPIPVQGLTLGDKADLSSRVRECIIAMKVQRERDDARG